MEEVTESVAPEQPRARRIMRRKAVLAATGYSNMSLHRAIQKKVFPEPIALTDDPTGPVGWWEDEVISWQNSRPRRQYKAPKSKEAATCP